MPKRSPSNPGASISLFPFLAVLICTMGSLVTLLFAFAKHGQDQATKAAEAKQAAQSQSTDVTAEREDLEWKKSQLLSARGKTQEQLTEKQLELSHVEDHIQRLRQQADEVRIAAEELAKQGLSRSSQFEDAEGELERLRRAIEAAKQELKEEQLLRKERPVTYSVVPYQGPNQTKRRPIYIECRLDGVIVQPENIVLRESDFEPPLGPGNPLAAALRAYSEHLARAGFTGESTRPYPMLLVRPDGIVAYYAARSALESWGTEFGYELVGEDWKLDFPPADRGLENDLQQVVAQARVRQEALALAAPRQFKRSRGTMRASPNGRGFIYEGEERGSEFGGSGFAQRNARGGRGGSGSRETGSAWGAGVAESAGGGGRYGAGGTGNEAGTGNGVGELAGNNPGGINNGLGGSESNGGGSSSPGFGDGPYGASGQASNEANQPGGLDNPPGDLEGTAGGPQAPGEGGPSLGDAGGTAGAGGQSRFGERAAGQTGNNSSNEMGEMGTPGQGFQADAKKQSGGGSGTSRVGGQPGDASSPSSMGGSEGSSSDGSQGAPSMTAHVGANKPKDSLAKKRGADWGLPDSNQHMVPVTRPVIVRCEPNQLTIIPDEDRLLPKKIAMGNRTEDSVDALVSGVWDQMKAWGLAGRGMYWKPTLVIEVAPGAEARYAELQQLLAGSGMEVKQRATTATRRR